MKIAFYNHTSKMSGAEISLLLTVKHLTQARPVIFAPEGELLDKARKMEIEVCAIPSYNAKLTKNPMKFVWYFFGMTLAGWRFARMVKGQNIDIIHANSIRAGIMATMFTWLHNIPTVWHIRDMPPGGWIGSLIGWLARMKAGAVIGISRSVLDRLPMETAANRLFLIHNGVELIHRTSQEQDIIRRNVRCEFETEPEVKVAVIIGQIAQWKRQEDAIKAAHRLRVDGFPIRLWVVGEPKFRKENEKYYEYLKELVRELDLEDCVLFTGFREDVLEICCAADLLMLCSENEPFGRVIIEAMSQGTPVIGTDAGGVPEIIRHGESGLLYPVGDVTALVENMKSVLTSKQLWNNISDKGRKRVYEMFSIKETAKKVEAVYEEVLRGGKSTFEVQSAIDTPKWKVAIVHDYLNQMGGAERVVGVLHSMFPNAPIFTTIVDEKKLLPELKDALIHTTFMQRIPGILKHFKLYFWLYPFAVRTLDLREYNIILSSSSAFAKGIRKSKGSVHISYCHTPMRFAWDFDSYMEGMNVPKPIKKVAKWLTALLRIWDQRTSWRVDRMIANSSVVQERILQYYGLQVPVIFPPVDIKRFSISPEPPLDYFLVVSRLVSYKRIDLAIEACSRLNQKLIIIGDGPDRGRLESIAGKTVTFLGRRSDREVVQYMQGCKALIFPGLEDFGITPLEANACGRPVIAYSEGGALDTIITGVNGLFFKEQRVEEVMNALKRFELCEWDPEIIRNHAENFNESIFMERMFSTIQEVFGTNKDQLGTIINQQVKTYSS